MNTPTFIVLLNLFCAGLLAGEEFTIRYGVRAPLAGLNQIAHIEFRQALIRRLRILVPVMFAVTVLSGIASIVLHGIDAGFILRCAGLFALAAFMTVTLRGTVPINQAALEWNPAAPPADWQALIRRWEQLDTVRCSLAVAAFVCLLIAAAL